MPIVNGKYINPGWTNGTRPPINAQNLNDISDSLERIDSQGTGGGSGNRTCRFVIGTAAAGWTAADCDYLCDGTDDDLEIQAAIDALPAAGGEIVILDGTYNLSGPIQTLTSTIVKPTVIRGNGSMTELKRTNVGGAATSDEPKYLIGVVGTSTLCNLTVNGNNIPLATGERRFEIIIAGGGMVQNCIIRNYTDTAIIIEGNYYGQHTVSYNKFFNSMVGSDSKRAVWIAGGLNALIANNYFQHGGLVESARSCHTHVMLTGNVSEGDGVWKLDGLLYGSTICGNTGLKQLSLLQTGEFTNEGTNCLICGNNFASSGSDVVPIVLGANTKFNFVTGNLFFKDEHSTSSPVQDNGTGNVVRWNSDDTSRGTPSSTMITLASSGWSNKQQTVIVKGVSANEAAQLITAVPTAASQSAYYNAGVRCTAQMADSLTFTADTVPTASLSVYVVVQEVA